MPAHQSGDGWVVLDLWTNDKLKQPNPFHIAPLSDQIVGAVIMWVVGSLVFLIPAVFITVSLLQQDSNPRV